MAKKPEGGDRVALALATSGLSELILHERKKLRNKYRTALTATVNAYVDTARQLRSDPLGMTNLSPTGAVFLGWELEQKLDKPCGDKDSVWWVELDPNTLAIKRTTSLAKDLSKWKKALNKQLKAWDVKSEVKHLRNKRRRNGFIIAGIVVAIAVITIFTFGAGTGPSVAGAAVAANTMAGATAAANASAVATVSSMATGAATTGLAAGGGGVVSAGGAIATWGPKVVKGADIAFKAGKGINDIATAAKAEMPLSAVQAVDAEAVNAESEMDDAVTSEPGTTPYMGPGVGAIGGAIAGFFIAGPPGAIAGAIGGGVAGHFAGKKLGV